MATILKKLKCNIPVSPSFCIQSQYIHVHKYLHKHVTTVTIVMFDVTFASGIMCGHLMVENSNATNVVALSGSTVMISCMDGYETETGTTLFEAACGIDGVWVGVERCKR